MHSSVRIYTEKLINNDNNVGGSQATAQHAVICPLLRGMPWRMDQSIEAHTKDRTGNLRAEEPQLAQELGGRRMSQADQLEQELGG
ncbi:hypothetical protein EXN66_Car006469 [Channa argus]|uniref:Uncharacterized protein n=1 Tax=Channa argus TaxID=215402 RepID=A0A6G1PKI5_CHAAH|nr:hypothetical protein EXN66_Car006469 [Channa argus]